MKEGVPAQQNSSGTEGVTRRSALGILGATGLLAACDSGPDAGEQADAHVVDFEKNVAERETIIEKYEVAIRTWLQDPEVIQAYEKGNLELFLRAMPLVTGRMVMNTKYDPVSAFQGQPPIEHLNASTGEIGSEHDCNVFRVNTPKKQSFLSAAHCVNEFMDIASESVNMGHDLVVLPNEDEVVSSSFEFNTHLTNQDVMGKLVVGVGYDSPEEYAHHESKNIKLFPGFAVCINKAMAETIISLEEQYYESYAWDELRASAREKLTLIKNDREMLLDNLEGSFFTLRGHDFAASADSLSGSPVTLGGKVAIGVLTDSYAIPAAEGDHFRKMGKKKHLRYMAVFPGPENTKAHLAKNGLL